MTKGNKSTEKSVQKSQSSTEKSTSKQSKEIVFEREQFSSYNCYLFMSIGTAIGFSNFFRFPHLMITHGGIAYFIPYMLCVICVGFPMSVMELCLGQLGQRGAGIIFGAIAPLFQGVGFAMVLTSFIRGLRFNTYVSYLLFYAFDSFRGNFLWSTCKNDWNSANCYSSMDNDNCKLNLNNSKAFAFNKSCYDGNDNSPDNIFGNDVKLSMEEYFRNRVLQVSVRDQSRAEIVWELVLLSMAGWLIIFLVLAKGLRVIEKLAYFMTPYYFVVFVILTIHLFSLADVRQTSEQLMQFDFSQLAESKTWSLTVLHTTVWSLNIGDGYLHVIGSYKKEPNNVKWVVFITLFFDTVASLLLASCSTAASSYFKNFYLDQNVTASLMKNMDHEQFTSRFDPVFVAFPFFLQSIQGGQIYSFLFYVALIFLGLDSQYFLVEMILLEITDMHHPLRKEKIRMLFLALICFVGFLFSLTFCTRSGYYISSAFFDYSSGWPHLTFALMECLVVVFVYGIKHFADDIALHLKFSPGWYLTITWTIIAPVFLVVLIPELLREDVESRDNILFDKSRTYIIAVTVSSGSLMFIFGFALYRFILNRKQGQSLIRLFLPNLDWPPKKIEYDSLIKEIEDAEKGVMGSFPLKTSKKETKKNNKLRFYDE